MRLFCDIDGVLADFVGGAAKILNYDPAVVTTWDYYPLIGTTEKAFWAAIDEAGSDYWANLEAYSWADELDFLCKNYDERYVLLTSPSKCPSSHHGKMRWMASRYGKGFRNYLIGPRKEYCAREGSVLIDDSDANCEKFKAHGGKAIVFPQPWNKNAHIPASERLLYVSRQLQAIDAEIASCS